MASGLEEREFKREGSFPTTFADFFKQGTPHAAPTFDPFTLDEQTKRALLQLPSRQASLVNAGTRQRVHLPVFFNLLDAFRRGDLIISMDGLGDKQDSGKDDKEDDAEGDDADTDSAGPSHGSVPTGSTFRSVATGPACRGPPA